jgi:hypothetical protein
MSGRRLVGLVAAFTFLATIIVANILTSRYGFIPVGFGLTATAGTLMAGALPGQFVGKAWATLAFLVVGWAVSRAVLRQSQHAEGA